MKTHRCLAVVMLVATFAPLRFAAAPAVIAPALRPNVLVIMADDCTFNDLPAYGGQNAKTPAIDALAAQGLVFNRAYLAMAACQPARSELFTGQFPARNGSAWNHSASRNTTRSLPEHLGALGYRVGIAGKVHLAPRKNFPFESVPGFDPNSVNIPTRPHSLKGARDFMTRRAEEPFCLVVALVEPHLPWVMGDASMYPPDKIKLPANIADTPTTRSDFGRYLAEITYMDRQVGDILATLKEAGLDENTLVLFTSEQGSQFPGNKWTCWDTGLHTALIARWPGKVPAGKRTDAIVEYVDVTPTLLELAGGEPGDQRYDFDGTAFSTVLFGQSDTHRTYAYGMLNNVPEGPPYPIRTVTDGRWRYIRNLRPEEVFLQNYIMGFHGSPESDRTKNAYWGSWVNTSHRPETYRLIKRYLQRPPEELYDTANDPYELRNLVGNPEAAAIKTRLSQELDSWMTAQGDAGAIMDTPAMHQASKRGEFDFSPPPRR